MLRNIIFVFDLNNLIDTYAIYFEKLFKWRNTSLNLVWIFLLLVCARFPKYGVGFVITFLTMHPIKLARILQLPNQAGHNESLPGAPRSYLDSAALNLAAYTKSLFDCWATYWNSEEERYFFRFLPFQIYGCVCALLFIVWDLHDCISAALLFPFIYFTAPRYMNPLKFAMEVHHLLCIAAEIVNFRRTAILNRIDQVDLVDHGQRLCWKVEVMENQRWWAGIGWSDGMLQGDPGQWSSITGISRRQGMEFYQALEPYGKGPWAAGDWIYSTSFKAKFTKFPDSKSLIRIVKRNELMELPLVVGPTRASVALIINLPEGFPHVPPIIKVLPAVAQRWVDSEMRVVGHEALTMWNRNMSLGKIVKDIEIEFNLRPPTVITVPGMPFSVASGHGDTVSSQTAHQTAKAVSSERTQRANLEFSEVGALNLKKIKQLLENEDEFEDFFLSCRAVQEVRSFQDELLRSNYEMAKKNIDLREKVNNARDRMEELDAILELEEAEVRRVYEANKQALEKYSEESILASFVERVKEVEGASQSLMSALSNEQRSMDVTRFLAAYRKVRQSFHQQTALMEKYRQTMSQ